MGILDQLSKLGKEISTHLGRKAQKPLNQYKAIEKAHEAIEDHKIHPKRAPMNVPRREFTEEHKFLREKDANEKLLKDDQILDHLKHINVTSTDSDFGPPLKVDKSNYPKRLTSCDDEFSITSRLPRGLVLTNDVIDILSNHSKDEETWNNEAICEKFHLRQSDVDNLLQNFSLLKQDDFLYLRSSQNEKL